MTITKKFSTAAYTEYSDQLLWRLLWQKLPWLPRWQW